MDVSKEEKQKYLVTEIIDKGYDPEDFQDYLYNVSGKEIDLDSW